MPALEEASTITRTLDHLAALRPPAELIVVDGGSRDATAALAAPHPARPRVLTVPGGRAASSTRGRRWRGALLVFLHADTRLPPGAGAALAALAARPEVAGGNFALRFDGSGIFPRLLGAVYAVQRHLGVSLRRLGHLRARRRASGARRRAPAPDHGRLRAGPAPAPHPPRRVPPRSGGHQLAPLEAHGHRAHVAAWGLIRWFYLAGVSPARLARFYRVVR